MYSEVENRRAVDIDRVNQIGDIPVNEDLARVQADDLICRHPAVRAADPEILRLLLARQALKKGGIPLMDARRPDPVVLQ